MNSCILGTSLHDLCAKIWEKYYQCIYDNIWVQIGLDNIPTIYVHDILTKNKFANFGPKGEPIATLSIQFVCNKHHWKENKMI